MKFLSLFHENIKKEINLGNLVISHKKLKGMILEYGLDSLYLGDVIEHFSNGEMTIRNMDGVNLLPRESYHKKTIFKHDSDDYYYYDLLDKNNSCEEINDAIIYLRYGCSNLQRISDLLDYKKGKVIVKQREELK